MSGIMLTAYSGAILGPIAKFLGWVMDGIYTAMYNLFGIESVILSIAIITIIIYMCLLPLTIKQQKFSKLSQAMQPEIQKIQEKYKNRKDQASVQAMQQETQMVYEKYGVSPTGSCVQTLIQMPILFALYRVFYNIPGYISSVKQNYMGLVDGIKQDSGYIEKLTAMMSDFGFNTSSNLTAANVAEKLSGAEGETLNNYIVDILYKLPSSGWESVDQVTLKAGADAVNTLSGHFSNLSDQISAVASHAESFNYFLGMNISDTPWYLIKLNFMNKSFGFVILALMIPVLAYLTQLLSIKLMPQATNGNDQMAQQMKTMNLMMPLMSFVICFTVPVGLGIYWIMTAVVRSIQQFFINKHIKNLDLDEVIEKNREKAKKRREKMGITDDQIRQAAAIKTRTIESKAQVSGTSEENETILQEAAAKKASARPGSMAAKANMVRDFNERNSRK